MVRLAGKISVIGAGAVGSAAAYAMLIRRSAAEVVLYDVDAQRVDAEILDLTHGRFFVGGWPAITGGADITSIADSDIIVFTAGAKQEPGQSRRELAAINARILAQSLQALLEQAPHAVIVIVSNPCDALTVVAQEATGLPPNRIFSSGTVLDSSRLRGMIAERAEVSTDSVHVSVVGEHGDSEFVLWSAARIGSVPIRDYRIAGKEIFTEETLRVYERDVMMSAYRVIEGKGATNYAIGLSCARICEAILRDERAILPVSSILTGQWGISEVALAMPTVVGRSGAMEILDTPLSLDEEEQLWRSAEAVQETLARMRS
nr:L-lactate dehydrogenase [Acaricomes phytoseiuli]